MVERASPAPVQVVIVAHNSGEVLHECALRALRAEGVAELVIVDNASDDGACAALMSQVAADGRARLQRNNDNSGFAVACNQGANSGRAPWIAFLNPDCFVERDTFTRMLATVGDDPRVGVLGADVRDAEGEPEPAARRRDPVPARAIPRALGLKSRADSSPPAMPDTRGLTEVDAVSGALMLMPRASFDRLQGFDEGYRLHCEDLDLCRRARDAGLIVAVVESARVTHLKGTSSRRRPYFVQVMKHRGMWRYYRKFDARRHWWPTRAIVGAGIAASCAFTIARAWWRARLGRGA